MRISAIYVPGFDRHVLSVDSLIKKGSKIEMNSNGGRLISEVSGKVANLVKGEQGLSYLQVKRVKRESTSQIQLWLRSLIATMMCQGH
jgi:hypothetical protein